MDFEFGNPTLLWLLWLVPLFVLFSIVSEAWREQLRLRFAANWPTLATQFSVARRRRKSLLVLLALTCLCAALAEPRLGFTWEQVPKRGVDVIIALDLSDSMLVEDGAGGDKLTRLVRAKRKLADLLAALDGDRVGIVAFAGAAYLECPLTLDYRAAAQFLDALDTHSISAKGTALGAAIRTALRAFAGGGGESQAIVLISDGEDTIGDAGAAADEARAKNVRIYAIGIGRDEGAPIPDESGAFRRDAAGELVLSKLDEPGLQQLALRTGGSYVRSVSGDIDIEAIVQRGIKADLTTRGFEATHHKRWHERHPWLVGVALLALAVEALLGERKNNRSAT